MREPLAGGSRQRCIARAWRLIDMRYQTLAAVAASIVALGACGGGNKDADTGAAKTSADTGTAAATTPAATTTPNAPTVAKAPVTGAVHEVKMVMDSKGYRF